MELRRLIGWLWEEIITWSGNCMIGYLSQKNKKVSPQKYLHTNIYSSSICFIPKLEISKMSLIWSITVNNSPVMQETWVQFLDQKDPPKRKWQHTPAFLPGKFHGQRSLVGCSPRGHQQSDTTEWLTLSVHVHSCINAKYSHV